MNLRKSEERILPLQMLTKYLPVDLITLNIIRRKYGVLRELAQTDGSSTILIIIMISDLTGGEGPWLPCELGTVVPRR